MKVALPTPIAQAWMQGYIAKQAAYYVEPNPEDSEWHFEHFPEVYETPEELRRSGASKATVQQALERNRRLAAPGVDIENPQRYKTRGGAYSMAPAGPIGAAYYAQTKTQDKSLRSALTAGLAAIGGGAVGAIPGLAVIRSATKAADSKRSTLILLGMALMLGGATVGAGETIYQTTKAPTLKDIQNNAVGR